ncbi:gas vesicle protein [Stenotrophomonas maltophilia]|uniref:gas vesicle protein n=1 Tax=Stenotrophomonas maltophilia TaxID=40324 RepID=UPI000A7A9B30|nr:gas vesicle protein [Stenotrophomonas maltophilia]MBH1465316.1 gas vesicle protein [Stenotrophomonas maltophilia]MBH1613004.1 gas vesicle protein [Stenotrophomonas maltophilia]MBN5167296.1 gas vesicle protein [Stenotrophomonas maltophilia]
MTESTATPQTQGSDTDVIDAPPRLPDALLQELVEIAGAGFGFGITLTVGGTLVTGNVCSGSKYMQFIFEESLANVDEQVKEAIKKRLQPYADIYAPGAWSGQAPTYIHLENARFVTPGVSGSTPASPVIWRGRISDVSGFFFGVLG